MVASQVAWLSRHMGVLLQSSRVSPDSHCSIQSLGGNSQRHCGIAWRYCQPLPGTIRAGWSAGGPPPRLRPIAPLPRHPRQGWRWHGGHGWADAVCGQCVQDKTEKHQRQNHDKQLSRLKELKGVGGSTNLTTSETMTDNTINNASANRTKPKCP